MSFKEYLENKKIDPEKFKDQDQSLYRELQGIFQQVHPDSFTQQKLFLINPLRLKYPFVPGDEAPALTSDKPGVKPKIPRIKPS